MVSSDNKIVRVRGGSKGFRLITLGDWKGELAAKRGKAPKIKSRRDIRMKLKMRTRAEKQARSKAKDKANKKER